MEFVTKEDAKRAFDLLSHSTHLYGRRLILEWAEEEESLEAVYAREQWNIFMASSGLLQRELNEFDQHIRRHTITVV